MDTIKKILVPIDFSEHSTNILQTACHFAEKLSANLILIYVVEDLSSLYRFSIPHISFDQLEGEMMQSADTKMENFLTENINPAIVYKSKIISGPVAEEIINAATTEHADMIIIGTHGYKGMEKMLMGSVAAKVVHSAPCPVLTLRP